MSTSSAIAQQVEHESVLTIESTIPDGTTVAQWRRGRAVSCEHMHETTTRYDHERKLLTFLLCCPECGTEKVVETQHYEPRYEPHPAPSSDEEAEGARVYEFPVRTPAAPLRAAA